MSGFTTQALEKKLIDLNSSQQSIQTLSLWLIHHRKHHKPIVQTWFKELRKAKASRRLTFMYLANDVIQNSRKKGPEFSKEFGAVLKPSFETMAKDSDDKTLASLERILSIWETRSIYESNQINSFKTTPSLRRSQQTVKEVNNSNNNNNINESNVKEKSKDKERQTDRESNREKRTEHHNNRKEQKSSKDSKQSSDKRDAKESKKRKELENNREIVANKKRTTDELSSAKKSVISVIAQNQTKQKVTKSLDKMANKTNTITAPTTTTTTSATIGPTVDPEVLIKALQELESSASADAGVRQKIASLPTEVFDATLLDRIRDKGAAERLTKLVDEARALLADYNNRLSQELEDRKSISLILSSYTQSQRDALSGAEQRLNEYKEKLRKVVQVRNELKSHLQNLPDLSRLPSVTGLAPLPSACDLFNVARINTSAGSVSSSVSPNESNASPGDYGTPGSNTS